MSLDTSQAAGPLQVSFPTRAEQANGQTSPEELIAAAHASCYSMALSKALADAGTPPESLETSAVATFDITGGPHISQVSLTVRGTVPNASEDDFRKAAEAAKDGCPVSQALAGNVAITLDAALAS